MWVVFLLRFYFVSVGLMFLLDFDIYRYNCYVGLEGMKGYNDFGFLIF